MSIFRLSNIIKWLERNILFGLFSPYVLIPFELLSGIVLVALTELWVTDPGIQILAELTMVAFTTFAIAVTWAFQTDIRRYITHELLVGIGESNGRMVTNFELTQPLVSKILPGQDFTIQFRIRGRLLFKNPLPTEFVPGITISPPIFLDTTGIKVPIWKGKALQCDDDYSTSSWKASGEVEIKTNRIDPQGLDIDYVNLQLSLQESWGKQQFFQISLGNILVHSLNAHEIFHRITRLGLMRKLPPGYSVLRVSGEASSIESGYHTNLLFLPRKFVDMKNGMIPTDEETLSECLHIEAAIAHFVNRAYHTFCSNLGKGNLELIPYGYIGEIEKELNDSQLVQDIIGLIPEYKASSSTIRRKILVANYHTYQYVRDIRKNGHLGICLFGFSDALSPELSSEIRIIFDLSKILDVNSPWGLSDNELINLTSPEERDFEEFLPTLKEKLTREPALLSDVGSFGDESYEDKLEVLLHELMPLAASSLRYGTFINSEPTVTRYWINLRLFETRLMEKKEPFDTSALLPPQALIESIKLVIDRCVEHYQINKRKIRVMNCCSKNSYVSRELETLWGFEHDKFKTYDVNIDEYGEVSLNVEPTYTVISEDPRDIIVIVPFDSYTRMIQSVINYFVKHTNNVISIITIFSIADTWEYQRPSGVFDIVPLYRISKDLPAKLAPLSYMADYIRIKPWLVGD